MASAHQRWVSSQASPLALSPGVGKELTMLWAPKSCEKPKQTNNERVGYLIDILTPPILYLLKELKLLYLSK